MLRKSSKAPIPEEWRKTVLRILRNGQFGREIQAPKRVFEDWEADSFQVRDPLIDALSREGVIGKLKPNQPEPGITYAFWMHYTCGNDEQRKFYAKICLFGDQVTLKILSAHLPNKGNQCL